MLDDRGAGNTVTIAIGADTQPQTITVAGAGATTVTYKHNAFGERVSRVEGSTTTHFHYDQDGRLIAESDGTGVVIREYLWLGDKPLGLVVGPAGSPTLYFVHDDHLERVQKITDATQAIVWDGQFTPYGRTHAIAGTVQNPLRFPGQWADPAANYFYNYMRDYDPTLARYLSSDPIGTAGGRNRFSYASANPQNSVDQFGLFDPCIGCTPSQRRRRFGTEYGGPYARGGVYSTHSGIQIPLPSLSGLARSLATVAPPIAALLATAGALESSTLSPGLSTAPGGAQPPQPPPPGGAKNCPVPPPEDDCKHRLSDFQIRKMGEDPHEIKREELGRSARISRFELCLCKDGRVVIRHKNCSGPMVETGLRL